jgi:D-alanine--poly(phosphoribitol) ligase subunit 1
MLKKIQNACIKFKDENAFYINGEYFSYQVFAQQISNVRHLLELNQLKDSSKLIGVITFDEIYTYSSIIGVLFAGYGFVPINPANPIDRNESIINQSGIKIILTSTEYNDLYKLPNITQLKVINTSQLDNVDIDISIPDICEDEIAYLLFTSGSTGIPKGVPISRRNLHSFIDAFFALGYELSNKDRFLQMFDLTFDLSLMSYMTPLCIGACVYTVPFGEIKYTSIYSLLEDHNITIALMVPSILSYLRPYFDDIRLPDLKYSLFCGEALYNDITNEWSHCVPNALVQNVYGPTEATIFCLTYDWAKEMASEKSFNGIVCIGKPMNNMFSIIVDEQLKELPAGEKGELCLSGGQLTSGYWNNPEKNKDSFFKYTIKGVERTFYKTGDLCFIDLQGDFMFCGRVDHQVKIQGFRVELSEIEHHVRAFTELSQVAAIASADIIGNTQIILFLEKYKGNLKELNTYLKEKLPSYMIPAEIKCIDMMPLNSNGKIDRKALKLTLN